MGYKGCSLLVLGLARKYPYFVFSRCCKEYFGNMVQRNVEHPNGQCSGSVAMTDFFSDEGIITDLVASSSFSLQTYTNLHAYLPVVDTELSFSGVHNKAPTPSALFGRIRRVWHLAILVRSQPTRHVSWSKKWHHDTIIAPMHVTAVTSRKSTNKAQLQTGLGLSSIAWSIPTAFPMGRIPSPLTLQTSKRGANSCPNTAPWRVSPRASLCHPNAALGIVPNLHRAKLCSHWDPITPEAEWNLRLLPCMVRSQVCIKILQVTHASRFQDLPIEPMIPQPLRCGQRHRPWLHPLQRGAGGDGAGAGTATKHQLQQMQGHLP